MASESRGTRANQSARPRGPVVAATSSTTGRCIAGGDGRTRFSFVGGRRVRRAHARSRVDAYHTISVAAFNPRHRATNKQ